MPDVALIGAGVQAVMVENFSCYFTVLERQTKCRSKQLFLAAVSLSKTCSPQPLLSLEDARLDPERNEATVDGRGFDSATVRPSGVLARSQSCSYLWTNQYAFQHGSIIACIYPTAAMHPWESISSGRGYAFCAWG